MFEVEANIGGNKDNSFLQYQMSDQITIDQSGAATHKLTWQYTWPNDPNTLAESFPQGSSGGELQLPLVLSGIHATGSDPDLAEQSGRFRAKPRFSGYLQSQGLFMGPRTHTITRAAPDYSYGVSWKTPGVVTHDSAGYHYHLLFQREAGIVWPLTMTIHCLRAPR